MIKILKYQFKHSKAKSSLKLAHADALLTDYLAAMHDEPTSLSVNKSVGMPPLPSLDSDLHINGDEYFVWKVGVKGSCVLVMLLFVKGNDLLNLN